MSNKPNPVALTSAMLMAHQARAWHGGKSAGPTMSEWNEFAACTHYAHTVAQLASAIHRLAPACARLALAECNGEWRDGQRQRCYRSTNEDGMTEALDKSIADYATRLDRRITKLNAQLAPFGYQLIRQGDPRGATLVMAETPVRDSATHYAIG